MCSHAAPLNEDRISTFAKLLIIIFWTRMDGQRSNCSTVLYRRSLITTKSLVHLPTWIVSCPASSSPHPKEDSIHQATSQHDMLSYTSTWICTYSIGCICVSHCGMILLNYGFLRSQRSTSFQSLSFCFSKDLIFEAFSFSLDGDFTISVPYSSWPTSCEPFGLWVLFLYILSLFFRFWRLPFRVQK